MVSGGALRKASQSMAISSPQFGAMGSWWRKLECAANSPESG